MTMSNNQGINYRSEFGLRSGTKVFKPVFIRVHFVLRPVRSSILSIFWYFLGPSMNSRNFAQKSAT